MTAIEAIMEKAYNPKNWKKTHKKSYEVYVCRPLQGAECTNRLEGTHYVTDENKQFILSGTVGETWTIDVNKLAKTYTFADGAQISDETLTMRCNADGQMGWQKLKTRSDANINWAMLIPKSVENFPVQTSWGDTLLANRPGIGHGLGDFLVCADNGYGQPNLNDVWVVNGEVFPTTYDLHAFPNMFTRDVTTATAPYPKHNFVRNNIGTNNLYSENMETNHENHGMVANQQQARTVQTSNTRKKHDFSKNTSVFSLFKR